MGVFSRQHLHDQVACKLSQRAWLTENDARYGVVSRYNSIQSAGYKHFNISKILGGRERRKEREESRRYVKRPAAAHGSRKKQLHACSLAHGKLFPSNPLRCQHARLLFKYLISGWEWVDPDLTLVLAPMVSRPI